MRRKQRIKISDIITAVNAIILVWIVISYFDVVINIDNGTYEYAWWNLITLMYPKEAV
jgi:hypothetical protein